MNIHKFQQISESHCGPAVLQMLLDSIGIETTQEDITLAAGVEHRIEEHGVRIDQLAKACGEIAPQASFWYKYHSSLNDLRAILQRGYVVGVEWQGLFYEREEEEDEDGDYGHFSIVSYMDDEREVLIVIDPYKDFVDQDRIFSYNFFMRRWWDTNEIRDPYTGKKRIQEDVRLLFFITPGDEVFPPHLGLKKFASVG